MKKIFIMFMVLLIIYNCLPVDFFSNLIQSKINLPLNNDDILPNVYYINLKKRRDRRENILKQFVWYPKNKLIRVDAIEHIDGATGCGLSHIKALEEALNDNSDLDYTMIVEDDINFVYNKEKTKNILINMIKTNLYWNVITLACYCSPMKYSKCEIKINNKYLNKVKECNTTTGYIIRKSYIPYLISIFKNAMKYRIEKNIFNEDLAREKSFISTCIDQVWKNLQYNHWYTPSIKIATQLIGFSDIERKDVNYDTYLIDMKVLPPVFFINLMNRTDRRDNIDKQFSFFNTNLIFRIDAIKHDDGATGCGLSHIKALKKAKEYMIEKSLDYAMIVEDDFKWKYSVVYTLDILTNILKKDFDWNVILLACSCWNNNCNLNMGKDIISKAKNCSTCTAYIIKLDYIDKLINLFEKVINIKIKHNIRRDNKKTFGKYNYHNTCIDQAWKDLQHEKWFLSNPLLAEQAESYSDIENKVIKYNFY